MRSTREGSLTAFMAACGSVDVLQVATALLELAHGGFGRIGVKRLYVAQRANQGFSHVLCHLLGIATDVEIRAVVEPLDEIPPRLPQAVLHIDLPGRVAREGNIHPGQR